MKMNFLNSKYHNFLKIPSMDQSAIHPVLELANPTFSSGEFNEAAHLKWLDEHPTKRPKVKEARKQVSAKNHLSQL